MWFEDLTGLGSDTPENVRSNMQMEGTRLTSLVNGRSFECGRLEIPTLAELRQQVKQVRLPEGNIFVAETVADAQALHADCANKNALFQVASQFNLLEMVSPSVTPEMGVDRYEHDHTQGPVCAMACGAGTIFRNYFVPLHGKIGQTSGNQIDCLSEVGRALRNSERGLWQMRNGYCLPAKEGLDAINQELAAMSPDQRDVLKSNLQIGLQWNSEVTLPLSQHTVSQAYCSALPVAYSSIAPAKWEAFARLVLEGAYEATLLAACLNFVRTGSPKLYLTLLGGGAFGNSTHWILESMEKALHKVENVPLQVRIVSYGKSQAEVHALANKW